MVNSDSSEEKKTEEPKKVEEGKYQEWLDHHYFECGDTSKKPYSIVKEGNIFDVEHTYEYFEKSISGEVNVASATL